MTKQRVISSRQTKEKKERQEAYEREVIHLKETIANKDKLIDRILEKQIDREEEAMELETEEKQNKEKILIIGDSNTGRLHNHLKKIQQNTNSFLNKKEINIATLNRFDRLWTKNTLKNFLYFFKICLLFFC